MKILKRTIFIILILAVIINLAYRLDLNRPPDQVVGELMYFPSGRALRALSLGFYAPLADIVWLRFIQYYGQHRMTDLQFEYMYHILDILTTLDPYFVHAYNLGALMLTHDAGRPDQAFKLLKKIMAHNPDEWRSYFMYGFINYSFLADYKIALEYIRLASQKPKAGDMPKRWAAHIAMRQVKDNQTAWALWKDIYENSQNPVEKGIAEIYMKDIAMEMEIAIMDSLANIYRKNSGKYPSKISDLVQAGLLKKIPEEPHGEKYYIKEGKIFSTYQQKLESRFKK